MAVAEEEKPKKSPIGTTMARIGLVILAATLVVAAFFNDVIQIYPFIVAIAVGLIAFGLLLNISARDEDE